MAFSVPVRILGPGMSMEIRSPAQEGTGITAFNASETPDAVAVALAEMVSELGDTLLTTAPLGIPGPLMVKPARIPVVEDKPPMLVEPAVVFAVTLGVESECGGAGSRGVDGEVNLAR